MNVELIEATERDRPILESLLQFYSYDFSENLGFDADDTDRFVGISLGGWLTSELRCFLMRAEGELAGFAVVDAGSVLCSNADVTDMGEFFVMRRYRRHGVGRKAARTLFDMFPGRWEVREVAPNVGAQAFWRRIIGDYTNGQYEERMLDDERWRGSVQSFVSNGGTQR